MRIQSNEYNNDNKITRNLKTELLRSILGSNSDTLTTEIINSSYSEPTLDDQTKPEIVDIRLEQPTVDVTSDNNNLTIEVELKDLDSGLGYNSGGGYFETIVAGSKLTSNMWRLNIFGPGSQTF